MWMKSQCQNSTTMSMQDAQTRAVTNIPRANRLVISTCHKDCPIRAEGQRPRYPVMPPEGQERLAISHAPYANLPAETAHSQCVTVRTECHRGNTFHGFREE